MKKLNTRNHFNGAVNFNYHAPLSVEELHLVDDDVKTLLNPEDLNLETISIDHGYTNSAFLEILNKETVKTINLYTGDDGDDCDKNRIINLTGFTNLEYLSIMTYPRESDFIESIKLFVSDEYKANNPEQYSHYKTTFNSFYSKTDFIEELEQKKAKKKIKKLKEKIGSGIKHLNQTEFEPTKNAGADTLSDKDIINLLTLKTNLEKD